jgi:hypothetical protein
MFLKFIVFFSAESGGRTCSATTAAATAEAATTATSTIAATHCRESALHEASTSTAHVCPAGAAALAGLTRRSAIANPGEAAVARTLLHPGAARLRATSRSGHVSRPQHPDHRPAGGRSTRRAPVPRFSGRPAPASPRPPRSSRDLRSACPTRSFNWLRSMPLSSVRPASARPRNCSRAWLACALPPRLYWRATF